MICDDESQITNPAYTSTCILSTGKSQNGVGYGMEMDSCKSRILDGVPMVLVQKQICTSPCLKSYGPCLNFFGTKRTHSRVPGFKGGALFLELSFFLLSADRILVQICTYGFLLYEFTHIDLYVNSFFIRFCMYQFVYTNLDTLICICKSFLYMISYVISHVRVCVIQISIYKFVL